MKYPTRFLASLLLCLFALSSLAEVHVQVSLRDLRQRTITRRAVLLTPIAPYPRTQSTNLFTREPLSLFTDTNGICTFSNMMWGTYRLDVFGTPFSTYSLSLGTNSTGVVSAAALIANPQALPPNPATNYYTMAQVDALLALVEGTSSGEATNLMIYDLATELTGDFTSLRLLASGAPSVDWNTRTLYDPAGIYTLNWETRELVDNNNITSVDWMNRALMSDASVWALNWNEKKLNGDWHATGNFSATNGFASGATNFTFSGISTRWTNTFGVNASLFVRTGTNFALFSARGSNVMAAITLASPLVVPMQPGWWITNNGITATAHAQ